MVHPCILGCLCPSQSIGLTPARCLTSHLVIERFGETLDQGMSSVYHMFRPNRTEPLKTWGEAYGQDDLLHTASSHHFKSFVTAEQEIAVDGIILSNSLTTNFFRIQMPP